MRYFMQYHNYENRDTNCFPGGREVPFLYQSGACTSKVNKILEARDQTVFLLLGIGKPKGRSSFGKGSSRT